MEHEILKRETMATHPERWAGPSVAICVNDGQTAVLAMIGYFLELAQWEQRLPPTRRCDAMGVAFECVGDGALLARPDDWGRVRVEIDVDATDPQLVAALLREVFGHLVEEDVSDLAPIGVSSISSNRNIEVPRSWAEAGMHATDLRVSTLPSRHGQDIPLIYGSRWVRILRQQDRVALLWSSIDGRWGNDARWPHACIPSFDQAWLRSGFSSPSATADDLLGQRLAELVKHEKYFVDSFGVELEAWEQDLFSRLSQGSDVFDRLELRGIQVELGHLAEFLGRCRVDYRALVRRLEESPALRFAENSMAGDLRKLRLAISAQREGLRAAFALLSSAATGEQLRTAQLAQESASAARESSERIQFILAVVTTVLLAPALVVGVYGANLSELASGAKGNLWSLAAWVVASVAVTGSMFRLITRAKPPATPWLVTAISCLLATGVLSLWAAWADQVPTGFGASLAISAAVLAGSLLVSALRSQDFDAKQPTQGDTAK